MTARPDEVVAWLLRPRKQTLWHPDSPGMHVTVVRTWIGRMFKDPDFATLGEALKESRISAI